MSGDNNYNAGILRSHISNGEFVTIMPPKSAAIYRKVVD
jgi:hypothetical protein